MLNDKVTIVIPYYNVPTTLHELLEGLHHSFRVIVIDNASRQPPRLSSETKILKNKINYGFSHAANQGLAIVTTPYVLFLNPDIRIEADEIRRLLKISQRGDYDAVSPVLVNNTHAPQLAYHRPLPSFLNLLVEFTPLHRLFYNNQLIFNNTILPGACLLVKGSSLHKIGAWNEEYWLWWEDADLSTCLRNQGFKLHVATDVMVKHQGGESFKQFDDQWKRQVFFHSLRIYLANHFNEPALSILKAITNRFSKNQLYPFDRNIRVSIIVPNLKPELMDTFLDSNLSVVNLDKDELIVVSSAELSSIKKWRQKYPAVVFIHLQKNKGFASTVNVGLRRARGRYLATVNDDTQLSSGWIESLIREFGDQVGSVSPQIVSPNGEVESMGIKVIPSGRAESNLNRKELAVDTFNAAAVLFSRTALEKVGLFDERFGSYLEDVDLGLRMSKAGFKHVVVPEVTVVHHKHQTSKSIPVRKAWYDFKNWWLIVLKNWSPDMWLQYGPSILLERARNFNGLLKTVASTLSRQSS